MVSRRQLSWQRKTPLSFSPGRNITKAERASCKRHTPRFSSFETNRPGTRQAWINEAAQSTETMLRDTLPGWNDNTLNELAGYAGKLGLTPQTAELAMLTPGFWQLVQKAKSYDTIQEQKAKLKPTSTLPKVHKPSAANQPNRSDVKRQDAEKRYHAKPSLDTLSSLIE